jgi:hypothetical protein
MSNHAQLQTQFKDYFERDVSDDMMNENICQHVFDAPRKYNSSYPAKQVQSYTSCPYQITPISGISNTSLYGNIGTTSMSETYMNMKHLQEREQMLRSGYAVKKEWNSLTDKQLGEHFFSGHI